MWNLNTPIFEVVIRAVVVYAGLFVLLRLSGKKQLGEMSPFDFVLLLIVSESVSNALTGDDSSLPAGILSAGSLIFLSYIMDRIAFRSKKAEKWLEGEAQLLIVNGKVRTQLLKKEKITDEELKEAMRAHGINSIDQIRYAVLEANGKISVIENPKTRKNNQFQPNAPV